MNRYLLLMAIPLLAGCNVHSKNPAGGDDNVTIQAEGNEIAFDTPIAQGKLKVPGAMVGHSDFDIDGVKLMPGSTVTGFSVFARDEGSIVNMAFNAPAAPDAVRAYFVDQFKEKGVEAALSGDSVTGKSKDGNPFKITVSPAGSGSQGKIEIQDKD